MGEIVVSESPTNFGHAEQNENTAYVFFSAPSDCNAEREACRELVRELDEITSALFGWGVRYLGLETTPPGFGRPQERINEQVRQCDIFVGTLWKRWGTNTGVFSSGFDEEFRRAEERSRSDLNTPKEQGAKSGEDAGTGWPRILLFFRKVPDSGLAEPDEQLLKVRAFKEKQGSRYKYEEYADTEGWRRSARKWLLYYIYKDLVLVARDASSASVETAYHRGREDAPRARAGSPDKDVADP